jgi:hypothetical protein
VGWQAELVTETPEEQTSRFDERVEERAELLPEELAAGSADPEAQAEAILEESDERVSDPEGTGEDSTQTTSSRPDPS